MDRLRPTHGPPSLPARAAGGLAQLLRRARLAPVVDVARAVANETVRRWRARPGARLRHLGRLGQIPLPNLYDLYPEARNAAPREIGLRSIDLADIVGTAVGGITQRGSDFKPLPPFRSANWIGRWQRIRAAIDRLAILPPIDLVRYPPAGRYWVLDGHNRVAAALEVGQVEIDANVSELVPPGENPTERPSNLASALTGTRSLRAAGQGGRLETVEDDVIVGVPGRADDAPPPADEGARPTGDAEPDPSDGPAPSETGRPSEP